MSGYNITDCLCSNPVDYAKRAMAADVPFDAIDRIHTEVLAAMKSHPEGIELLHKNESAFDTGLYTISLAIGTDGQVVRPDQVIGILKQMEEQGLLAAKTPTRPS